MRIKNMLFVLFFCLTACFKEPKKELNLDSKKVEINIAPKNIEIDSINKLNKEVLVESPTESNREQINDEIKDFINQLNSIFLKHEYYSSSISIFDLENGILKNGDYRFKVHEIVFYYLDKDRLDGYGRHHLVIECSFRESCILSTYLNSNIISLTTPFDSKESCEEAVEIFDKIKEAYYRK